MSPANRTTFEEHRRNNVVAPSPGGLEKYTSLEPVPRTVVRPQRWQMRTPGRSLVRTETMRSCGERRRPWSQPGMV